MFSIKRTGICQGCPEADLYIEKFYTDAVASSQFCFCEHQAACSRAWDLGFKEGQKSEKEDK